MGDCGTGGTSGTGGTGETGGTSGSASRTGRNVGQVGKLFGYHSVIVRLSFAHCSLIVYSSYIVLFRLFSSFFNFYIF